MNRLPFITASLLFFASLAPQVAADDVAPILRARSFEEQEAQPRRRLASYDAEERSVTNTRVKARRRTANSKELKFQLGILAGISSRPTEGNAQTNWAVGLALDVREYRYFGLEADSYYAFPPKTSEQVKEIGVLVNAKGQIPLFLDTVRVVPKLGVGYGFSRTTTTTAPLSEEDSADTDTISLNGPYATVGLEIEPIGNVIFMADYLQSFSAKGALKSDGFASESTLGNVKLERIRANLLYRFQKGVLAGAQYTRRTSRYDLGVIDTESISADSQLNQIQALLILEF